MASPPKKPTPPSTLRSQKHRAGLQWPRWEIKPTPHPHDRPAIKALAKRLKKAREKVKL